MATNRHPFCRYCEKPVLWVNTFAGSLVGLEPAPDGEPGAYVVRGAPKGQRGHGLRALVVAPDARKKGEPGFDLHRRYCAPAQEEYERHQFPARQLPLF